MCFGGLPEPEPYVLFAYAADNRWARAANDELESKYDPFYVLSAAERLLVEAGATGEPGPQDPPVTGAAPSSPR
ncbi:hypothetical protein [Blastococcus deserti]